MSTKTKSTKIIIVEAAWDLFYKKGYEYTTIDDIVESSHTSKGSFYHYFRSKSELLGTITFLFDEMNERLISGLDRSFNPVRKLFFITEELFNMIENRIPEALLAEYMALQITTKGARTFLESDRAYYRLLRQIFTEGQEQGIFTEDLRMNELIRAFATFERGVVYDWCLARGNYTLTEYGRTLFKAFCKGVLKEEFHYLLD
ncbi:MAG: TetR/AcrR family transcriptional regulator; helix-turn-helix transcriptional regulator [Clostridia bacterium]|nr:TetR/AcrR family transcriptional regulator; helix-turn-helix transcriptional regulator [Clostridia bacterium]